MTAENGCYNRRRDVPGVALTTRPSTHAGYSTCLQPPLAAFKQHYCRYLVQRYGTLAYQEIAAATGSDRQNRHIPKEVINRTLEQHKAEIIQREGSAYANQKLGEATPLERGEWWH